MNPSIKKILDTEQPKIINLDNNEKEIYKLGLAILSSIVCDDFFDIPRLPKNKYSTDGLFYKIPYYDSEQLWYSNNQRFLIVVYKIENKSSWCPLRIDFKFIDEQNFNIFIYDQSGDRTIKSELFTCEKGEYFTQINNYDSVKLSEFVNI